MKDYLVIRVNFDNSDTFAMPLGERDVEEFIKDVVIPDSGSFIETGVVQAEDAGAARIMPPSAWHEYCRKFKW